MTSFVTTSVKVSPDIAKVNVALNKAKQVAVQSMRPIYTGVDRDVLEAFNLSVEGPEKHVSYLRRLLQDANLKIG